jgi:hypothetical protein
VNGKITITFSGKNVLTVTCRRTVNAGELACIYTSRFGIPRYGDVTFEFDGSPLDLSKTLAEIGMGDGDIVDVHATQVGC